MKTFDVTEFTKLLNEKVRGREYTEASEVVYNAYGEKEVLN